MKVAHRLRIKTGGEIGRANKLTWDQRREIARLGGLATRGRRKRRRKDRPGPDNLGHLRTKRNLLGLESHC